MFTISITLPDLVHLDGSLWKRVLPRFQKEAGDLVVEAVQNRLGEPGLYDLSAGYAATKSRRKGYKHIAGKPEDQPLIFTGALYEGLVAKATGDGVEISVQDGAAVTDKGYDYAEEWEQKVQYLEAGLQDVEDQLPGLLEQIIVEEMLLDF